MATITISVTQAYLTITTTEAEWLKTQTRNYSGGLNINLWEKGSRSRLYVQLSGEKDKASFDLNAETLEAGMSVALAQAIVAFIEAKMPVVAEEIEEVVEQTAEQEISTVVAVPQVSRLRTGSTIINGEMNARFYSDDEICASMTAPLRNRPVDDTEAEALRNGKPYRLSAGDIDRLYDALSFIGGFDGKDDDPFIITGLARNMIVENPQYIAELESNNRKIEAMKQERIARGVSHGTFTIGVGMNNRRWNLTTAGRQWAREHLA